MEKLSQETLDRIDGLINTHQEDSFTDATESIIHDLSHEGFDIQDIATFLKMRIDREITHFAKVQTYKANKAKTIFGTSCLTNQGIILGDIVKVEKDLVIGQIYLIVDEGDNEWKHGYKYMGFIQFGKDGLYYHTFQNVSEPHAGLGEPNMYLDTEMDDMLIRNMVREEEYANTETQEEPYKSEREALKKQLLDFITNEFDNTARLVPTHTILETIQAKVNEIIRDDF